MKLSTTFLCLALGVTQFTFGQEQIYINENFNALSIGDLATDPTGATPGQNGWRIFGGTAADYQVTAIDAAHGRSLNITSGNNYSTTANTFNRFAYNSVDTSVATAANNLIKVQFDIYTGGGTFNNLQSVVYTTTYGVAGIFFDCETRTVKGLTRLTPTTTGVPAFYQIVLGTQTFPMNTWISVSYTVDKSSGAVTWTYLGTRYTFTNAGYTFTPNPVIIEHDLLNLTKAGNTVANTGGFDNLQVKSTNILSTAETVNAAKLAISVYPNPSTDFINVDSESKISKLHVYDTTGREINVNVKDNKIDVRNLAVGNYIISIETNDGVFSEKFIKK